MTKGRDGLPLERGERRFYVDDETDRLFFVDDGSNPEGALVEEISARDWYLRAGKQLACGWPGKHHPESENICPCNSIFPACTFEHWHKAPTRYFFHPESGSLFTTDGEDPGSDGLVEEIDKEDYERIQIEMQEDEALS